MKTARSVLTPLQVGGLLKIVADLKLIPPADHKRLSVLVDKLGPNWRAPLPDVLAALFPKATASNAETGFRNLKSRFEKAVQNAVEQGRLHAEHRLWLEVSQKGSVEVQQVWFTGRPPMLAAARLGDLEAVERAGAIYENVAGRPPGAEPILLVTVNDNERNALLDVFQAGQGHAALPFQHQGFPYDYLGEAEGDHGYARPVIALRTQMGSVRSGAAGSRVRTAIEHFRPQVVLAVGIAFGDKARQQLADVLIADQVLTYDSARMNRDGGYEYRSERPAATARWLERCLHVDLPQISRHKGLLLCGEKLVDNPEFRAQLQREFPRALGGDMEGFGLATVCNEASVQWGVIKAVSDWGDGSINTEGEQAKEARQRRAALHAALVAYSAVYLQAPNIAAITAARRTRGQPAPEPSARITDLHELRALIETQGAPQGLKDAGTPASPGRTTLDAADAVHSSLMRWLENPKAPPVFAVLGEYGMGKTISCQRLSKHLIEARQQPEAPAWQRKPIYFDLRTLSLLKGLPRGQPAPLPSAEALVNDLFQHGWTVPAGQPRPAYAELQAWLEDGALLILDGLDECLVHLDETQHGAFVQTLLNLLADHLPSAAAHDAAHAPSRLEPRLLISCRTNFFKTLSDQRNLFTGYRRGRVDAGWYEARVLLPLTEAQIEGYLQEVLPSLPTDQVLALIDSVHNLRELAERPMTLKMLGEYIPELEDARQRGKTVNGAYLYDLVARKWLQRDSGKHHLQPEHKLRLMPALAAHLWRSGVRSLPYDELHRWFHAWRASQPDLVARYADHSQDKLEEDLRTASFVVREDGEGGDSEGFRFAHSSLLEYFLAVYLAQAVQEDRFSDWAMPLPSRETLEFLAQRLELAQAALLAKRRVAGGLASTLNHWRRRYVADASELLLRYALGTSSAPGAVVPLLPGFDLRGAKLRGWRFGQRNPAPGAPELDLSAVCWAGADLRDAYLAHARLADGDFTEARLDCTSFQYCDLRRCRGAGTQLIGTVLRHCQLEDGRWQAAAAYRVQVVECTGSLAFADDLLKASVGAASAFIEPPECRADNNDPQSLVDAKLGLLGHPSGGVQSAVYSPDGNSALSGALDNTLRLWDIRTGECLRLFRGHKLRVTSVAFAPGGKFLLSGAWDRTLRLWDLDTGDCLRVLRGHGYGINSVAFAPDGRTVLSGARDNSLRLWDLRTGECQRVMSAHDDSVSSVAYAPDSRTALSGSCDSSVRVWGLDTGECLRVLQGHDGPVNSVAYAPDGRTTLSGSDDNNLRLWDVQTGECLRVLRGHEASVTSVAYAPDGRTALSGSDDSDLRLWDLHTGECLLVLHGHDVSVSSVAFAPNGHAALSSDQVNGLHLWNLRTGELCCISKDQGNGFATVAHAPDGRTALSGALDTTLRLWDLRTGECLRVFKGHYGSVNAVDYDPNGRTVLSGAYDRTLRLWDIGSGECLRVLKVNDEVTTAVAFAPDGRTALAGSWGSLYLWDLDSGDSLCVLRGHQGYATSAAFASDGCTAVSGAEDAILRLWDLRTGDCLRTLHGHKSEITCVAYAPDGRTVLSGSDDKSLRLWNLHDGECLHVMRGHKSEINSIVYTPDGRTAISGAADNTMRIWDLHTGECLRVLEGHSSGIASVSCAPDGRTALSASYDGSLRQWSLDGASERACLWIAATGNPDGVLSHASWRPASALSDEQRALGQSDQLIESSGDAWRFVAWLVRGHPSNPEGYTRLPLQG